MNNLLNPFIDSAVQCWGCPIFDRLFAVISSAAANVYREFSLLCILIFCILMAFYILNVVWQNIRGGVTDPFYQKSLKPVLINAVMIFALLGLGVQFPRFITTITFEPVADMAIVYTHTMLQTDETMVNARVTYKSATMIDDGFFRPQLRDKIILLTKTTITQFQSYIKLGVAIMDKAFSWDALLGIGAIIKHVIMFIMGLYLAWTFFRIFIKFCFYFVDVIVAMTFFAFFFPLSLVLFVFKDAADAPGWLKALGKDIGTGQIKNVINAIISLAAAVLTYTVIMVVIAKFFSGQNSTTDLMTMITSGEIFAGALSDENLAAMTLTGAAVLAYIVNFLADQTGAVTKMVLSAFNVEENNKLGEQLGKDALAVTDNVIKFVGNTAKTLMSSGKKDDKKETKDEQGEK